MALTPPVSAKIRIAVCHIDFVLRDLCAIEDEAFCRKIDKISELLEAESSKPHLLVFPEGCATEKVEQLANKLAQIGITTVCGTRYDQNSGCITAVVVSPQFGRRVLYKGNLSPYDIEFSAIRPKRGASAGGVFPVSVIDQHANPFQVQVGLLVCYDFRHEAQRMADQSHPQLFVVPMFDLKFDEPRAIASRMAANADSRTLLVNKASVLIDFDDSLIVDRKTRFARMLSRRPWLRRLALKFLSRSLSLPSSAHGPMHGSDERFLAGKDVGSRPNPHRQIWEQWKEQVFVADYEVGIAVPPGHDHHSNVGYAYSGFRSVAL